MSSARRRQEEEAIQETSFRLFMGTCGAITVAGIVYGVQRQLKKEKFKFIFKEHGSAAMMAAKAFAYGTLLCVGSFSAGGLAFCKFNNIDTKEDFSTLMHAKIGPLWNKSPTYKLDETAIKGMTEDEEYDYWKKNLEERGELEKDVPVESGDGEGSAVTTTTATTTTTTTEGGEGSSTTP
jgi:hypothetical protein